MGLTLNQARSIGLGHLHPAATGRTEAEVLRQFGVEPAVVPSKSTRHRGPTKLETAFMDVLEAAKTNHFIAGWRYEAVKLRLAGRTFYTPDFFIEPWRLGERFLCVETKGPYAREDSLIKLKVAADLYSCFRWLLVIKESRHAWVVREVTRTGIGRDSIVVPWIS